MNDLLSNLTGLEDRWEYNDTHTLRQERHNGTGYNRPNIIATWAIVLPKKSYIHQPLLVCSLNENPIKQMRTTLRFSRKLVILSDTVAETSVLMR